MKSILILVLLFAADIAGNPTVSPSRILATLNQQHPRLLATAEDFERLKNEIGTDPKKEQWFLDLQREASVILEIPPSQYMIPDGKRLLATCSRVKVRIYTLAMVYRLTGDQRFSARAWDELSAAAQFPDWNPKHFLDTALMTHAFAIGYDWLYDVWTQEQRDTLRNAIKNLGLNAALPLYRRRRGWVRARHNWNPVCNGGIGMGALAIADDEPALAGEILARALKSIPRALAEYGPDGAWSEGPDYWRFTTTYAVTFIAALESALGTSFTLTSSRGFSETCLFPIYLSGPTRRTFNFADSKPGILGVPAMFWLAKRFNRTICADFELRKARGSAFDFLWYDNSLLESTEMLPLDKYFRRVDVATFRSGWDDPNALFAGVKAGRNRVSHSHLDLGSFVLDALGHRWAEDIGPDNYNLPGYFGTHRWQYYRVRAEGQNTLVINPDNGADQNPNATAPIIRFKSDPELAYAITDLSTVYGMNVQRGIAMVDRQQVIIQDEIYTETPANVWWFMHTRATIELESNSAVLSFGEAKLFAEIISPTGATFSVMNAEPLPTSPNSTQGINSIFQKLAIYLPGVTETRIVVQLTDQQLNMTILPLAEW